MLSVSSPLGSVPFHLIGQTGHAQTYQWVVLNKYDQDLLMKILFEQILYYNSFDNTVRNNSLDTLRIQVLFMFKSMIVHRLKLGYVSRLISH